MKEMMSMMQNDTLPKLFPVIAFMREKQKKESPEKKKKGMDALERTMVGCGFDELVNMLGNILSWYCKLFCGFRFNANIFVRLVQTIISCYLFIIQRWSKRTGYK